MENLFFELLKVAISQQERLSHTPTSDEWWQLYEMADKQAVLGVCFKAIERLHQQEQAPPQELLYEWIGAAESIRATNEVVNKQCYKLQAKLAKAGIRSSILKGQAVARYYVSSNTNQTDDGNVQDLSTYRQSGDIDVYVDCGLKGALQFAKKNGCKDVEWDYKHLHLDVFHDTEVEMHYRVEVMLNLWKNRMLQRWFKKHEEEIFGHTESTDISSEHESPLIDHKFSFNSSLTTNRANGTNGFVTPSVEFNVFYILLHIYRHFLYEGVGMRQLMDYYFVLRHTDSTDIIKTLKEFGMMRFARGIMWVMQTVFGLEKEYLICEPLEREGRFILKEVMAGGNFGHYDERINGKRHGKIDTVKAICKHNWHLIQHYPAEVIWPPIWFVWHKCWKIRMSRELRKEL